MFDDLKFDLCCGARILYRAGLSSSIAGHLSTKVDSNTMIANRFGPSFGGVTPSDILTLDFDGNIQDGQGLVNDTILIHGLIHKVNPDIGTVVHTHPPAVVTFSAFRAVPEVYDQEGCFLAGDVGIVEERYGGLASNEERVRPMAEALGRYAAIILPNHGAITRGDDIKLAIYRMLVLEGMVKRHLAVTAAAQATGIQPRPIAPEVALATKQDLHPPEEAPVSLREGMNMVWEDLLIPLRQSDPALFDEREQTSTAAPQRH